MTSATTSARKAYDAMYGSLTGRSDLEVVAEGGGVFDEAIAIQLASIPGVTHAVPVLLQPTVVYLGQQRATLVLVGIDLAGLDSVHNYRLVSGRLPTADREIMLESQFARSVDLKIGQELKILARRGVKRLQVVGLLAPSNAAASNPAVALFSRLSDAQALFGRRGEVHAVQLVLSEQAGSGPGAALRAAAAACRAAHACTPAAIGTLAEKTMRAAELGLFFASALAARGGHDHHPQYVHAVNVGKAPTGRWPYCTIGATRANSDGPVGRRTGPGYHGLAFAGLPVGLGGGYFAYPQQCKCCCKWNCRPCTCRRRR